jgi:hypothetical protein
MQGLTNRFDEGVATSASSAQRWIENHPAFVFGFYSVLYFLSAFGASPRKPLWNDEYLVYFTSQLASVSTLWKSLREAPLSVDPPLYHLCTRVTSHFHLATDISLRLPSMIGFWMMLFSIFVVVRRRTSVMAALFASAIVLATPAQSYAIEARPYGLMAGCVGFTLMCWQTASIRSTRRTLALAGISICSAGALLSHYFAAVSLSAIVAAEAIRTVKRSRIDWAMWTALLVPFLTIAVYMPLLPAASGYRPYAPGVTWASLLECYLMAISPVLMPGIVMTIVWPTKGEFQARGPLILPIWEVAAALGLFLAPVGGFLVGLAYTHNYSGRYTLPFVIGWVVLLASGFERVVSPRLVTCGLVLAIGTALFSVRSGVIAFFRPAQTGYTAIEHLDPREFRAYPSLPIAVSRSEVFYGELLHGNPAWKGRCVGVVDGNGYRQSPYGFETFGMASLLEWRLRGWIALPIEDLGGFAVSNRRFLLWSDGTAPSSLREEGARLEWLGSALGKPIFLVTF